MGQLYPIIDRVNERTGFPKASVRLVYSTYFKTVRDVFKNGTHPGVVLTGLLSYQFKAYAVKNKYEKLEQCIADENYDALLKRFKVKSIKDAQSLLTNLKRIYIMKEEFDNQNKLAKKRKNNGWEKK